MLNIVLLEPEIPANTGNIGRTCVAAGAKLHLIEPMGFQINEKQVKRAGLDYWDKLDYTIYDSYPDFLEKNPVLPTCVRCCRRMGQERGEFCPVGYAAPFLVHDVFGESGEA